MKNIAEATPIDLELWAAEAKLIGIERQENGNFQKCDRALPLPAPMTN